VTGLQDPQSKQGLCVGLLPGRGSAQLGIGARRDKCTRVHVRIYIYSMWETYEKNRSALMML